MAKAKEPLDARKLSNWKLLAQFRQRLAAAQAARDLAQPNPTRPHPDLDPKRELLQQDYFSLILFGHFNPILDSMRGLCAASHLARVQEDVSRRAVSLGSFSEAQGVFDPELLKEVFLNLSNEVSTTWGDPRLAHMADTLKLVDGTLLKALPRMHWALWLDENNRAAKLHLKFNVLRQAACDALITTANTCERKTLRQFVNPGDTIVGDRYYGLEYGIFDELRKMGTSFVIRIRNEPKMEIIEELPLTDADRTAGVTWQAMVKLGTKWAGDPIRVVRIEANAKTLLVATDLSIEAELVSLIYRYRWQIELFFKWMKCILKFRHLIAESPEGVAIQTYGALIAALMLKALVGKKPTKRQMELIQFHFMGYVDLEEMSHILGLAKITK